MKSKELKEDIMKRKKWEALEEEEDVPFGGPVEKYKYQCSKCKFTIEVESIHVDAAYGWTKKRTKTSTGEIVPVMECFKCDNGKKTFICID